MYRIPKFHPKKVVRRRRKLRSLVSEEAPDAERPSLLSKAGRWMLVLCILTLIAVGVHSMSWKNFLVTYRDQYNLLVHGQKDYCKPTMETDLLFTQISEHVLNQDVALQQIETQLRNDSKFTAIAVVGRTGVGKTLFANALHDYFPWQENAQMLSWRYFHLRPHREKSFLSALRYLSDCGRNLIIIDDLAPEYVNFVQDFTNLAKEKVEETKASLIVLYVMNIATYTDEQLEVYDDELEQIRGVTGLKVVEFRGFGEDELRDCILHEARNLNYTLDEDSLGEVMKLIDVERSGCKNVHPKVLMYGQMADTIEN